MIKIYYPPYSFKIREPERKKEEIWDDLRKLWVRLTPEEWVRQNFIQYLVQVKNYPAAYISVEKRMKLGELNKRFDLLVFDNGAQPWMLVEAGADEGKGIRDAGTPVGPVMRAVPHAEFVRDLFLRKGDMQQAVAFAEAIVVTAIDPVTYFLQLIR